MHVTLPNLGFPYFNFLGGGPVKKNTLYVGISYWNPEVQEFQYSAEESF